MGAEHEDLDAVREHIDALDEELVALIAAREQLVLAAGRRKASAEAVRAPARVEQVVARVRAHAERSGASPDVVERTYRAMIAAFTDRELMATGLAATGAAPATGPAGAAGGAGGPGRAAGLPEGVTVEVAGPADAGELLTLQRAAWVPEARLYREPELPPLTQTLEELRAELGSITALKAVAGHRIVGTVRARVDGAVLRVERLAVAPDWQGRGIGSHLLAGITDRPGPGVRTAALFTGHLSAAMALYTRHGYVEERREQLREGLVAVHLTKALP